MPVGTTLLGLESTVSILNAMGFFACGLLTALNIKSVNWRELGKILGVMIVFMVLGIWLDTLVPLHILLKIYGVIIVIIGIKNLAVPQQKFMPEWALWIILALAGLIQGMFVSCLLYTSTTGSPACCPHAMFALDTSGMIWSSSPSV